MKYPFLNTLYQKLKSRGNYLSFMCFCSNFLVHIIVLTSIYLLYPNYFTNSGLKDLIYLLYFIFLILFIFKIIISFKNMTPLNKSFQSFKNSIYLSNKNFIQKDFKNNISEISSFIKHTNTNFDSEKIFENFYSNPLSENNQQNISRLLQQTSTIDNENILYQKKHNLLNHYLKNNDNLSLKKEYNQNDLNFFE